MPVARYDVDVRFRHSVSLTFSFATPEAMRAFADAVKAAEGVESVGVNSEPHTIWSDEHAFGLMNR